MSGVELGNVSTFSLRVKGNTRACKDFEILLDALPIHPYTISCVPMSDGSERSRPPVATSRDATRTFGRSCRVSTGICTLHVTPRSLRDRVHVRFFSPLISCSPDENATFLECRPVGGALSGWMQFDGSNRHLLLRYVV